MTRKFKVSNFDITLWSIHLHFGVKLLRFSNKHINLVYWGGQLNLLSSLQKQR